MEIIFESNYFDMFLSNEDIILLLKQHEVHKVQLSRLYQYLPVYNTLKRTHSIVVHFLCTICPVLSIESVVGM